MTQEKDITYWKNNCEEDYIKTPISVLRYISELEKLVASTQQETLYTEEEVIEFGEMIAWNMVGKTITESFIRTVSKELFKQFKKD
jgi:hypothetical protein